MANQTEIETIVQGEINYRLDGLSGDVVYSHLGRMDNYTTGAEGKYGVIHPVTRELIAIEPRDFHSVLVEKVLPVGDEAVATLKRTCDIAEWFIGGGVFPIAVVEPHFDSGLDIVGVEVPNPARLRCSMLQEGEGARMMKSVLWTFHNPAYYYRGAN